MTPIEDTASPDDINRELSLLSFHRRVQAMAEDGSIPLLERLRYICIAASNLDEFFQVRYASVRHKLRYGIRLPERDSMNIQELSTAISKQTHTMMHDQYQILNRRLIPSLLNEGIHFLRRDKWNEEQWAWLKRYFRRELQPLISPLGIDPAHPFPRVANKSLHFIVSLRGHDAFGREHHLAMVPAPRSLPRLIQLPESVSSSPHDFVFLSSIMHAFVDDMFQGMTVTGCYQFRLLRDTELYLDEEEMDDLKLALKGGLQRERKFGHAIRLEVADNCPQDLVQYLLDMFELSEQDLYQVHGPVDLARLASAYDMADRPELKFPPFIPGAIAHLGHSDHMFEAIARQDILLHHPFHSLQPVIALLEQAAKDPSVLAIKQTLYRTGDNSPLVAVLVRAARLGKEVTVAIELRARFDEEDNIELAERLQDAGASVVYGVVGYKTHAKMLMIVRREGKKLRRYVHLGTGNYHFQTSRAYTDIGLLTADEAIGEDVHLMFHQLTGLGQMPRMRKLIASPFSLAKQIISWIDGEAELAKAGKHGRIIAKMNGLEEPKVIESLYRASQAGVKITLIVRGICCLRPSIAGLSDNIEVYSVLGRFLEHTRIFYFGNNGASKLYCASADWMDRNLNARVETCFPIENTQLKRQLIRQGLRTYLREKRFTWRLHSDGSYIKLRGKKAESGAQDVLLAELTLHTS
ncbi:MAG: polyphosphate kinase 1 [Mariprofundales bacterium]|nr:polyphosphate kinase 1 [Mariprofundales bacterium]